MTTTDTQLTDAQLTEKGTPATAPRSSPTSTRRDRQRQATYDEIVEVSRSLLGSSPAELSLRGVAAEMGMTPPALYRYVDSHAQLLELVTASIFADVVAEMARARDHHPDDDPAAQVIAASVAFRRWALANRREFQMVFAADPIDLPDAADLPDDGGTATVTHGVFSAQDYLGRCTPGTGTEFAGLFGEIFGRLWAKYQFHVPSDDELDPEVAHALAGDPAKPLDVPEPLAAYRAGLLWTFERSWARLYGTVTLEVFGHLHPTLISTGAIFEATLRDIGRDLGLTDEWDRLAPVVRG